MTGDATQLPTFGELLRQYRLAAGLTQTTLAECAGVSVRAIQHLEHSLGQPQRETARRLAEALELTADRRGQFERAAAPAPRPYLPPRRADRSASSAAPMGSVAADDRADQRHDLVGECKHVTVLVAEIAGLTESAEAFEPDLADRLLSGALPLLLDVVHTFEGTVNRVGGGGIMALFGAPLAHEDDAIRACYAALAMHEAIGRYADQIADAHGVGMGLRVGLDSGEAVIRTARNDLYGEYTALGPAVRRASRLEHLAGNGATLLSRETLRLAEGYVRVRPVDLIGAGGLAEPLQAFCLLGTQPAHSRFQQTAQARELTRFVGRDIEAASLAVSLRQAHAGHGQVVGVVGEPGVGKSRLVWEVTRSPSTKGWLMLESGAVSYETATSYGPAIAMLKSYCLIEARDDLRTVREKLVGRVLGLDSALGPDLPALVALLDAPVEDAAWEALDPAQRRRRTLDALQRLMLRESQRQPLLLVLEDLHWVDAETQALLDILVESMPAARLLLLVTYRPEYEHAWGRKMYYTQIRVDPLPPAGAGALLDALVGDDAALQPVKQFLIRRTEGNPLFLEESVRELVETGALPIGRGDRHLTHSVEAARVPATVQAVLAARIDRLKPVDKRLLQTAAVIGKDVPFELLRAIVDASDDALHAGLSRLQAAELLYAVRLFPELELTFKHALTHEVAYGSLLHERRRALHARILDAIEALHGAGFADQAERLAHHAVRGEVWDKAEAYCSQVGAKAMARQAYREAATWQEQALRALERLPEVRETLARGVDLRVSLRNSLQPLGEIRRVLDHLADAEVLAERLGDRGRLSAIWSSMANAHWLMGEHDRAVDRGLRAVTVAEALSDVPLQIGARWNLAMPYWGRGEYRRALACSMANLAAIEDGSLQDEDLAAVPGTSTHPAIGNRSNSAWYLAELGDFDGAVALGEDGVRVAEALGHAYGLTVALFHLGGVHLWRGDAARAIPVLERALALCRIREFPFYVPYSAARLGTAYTLAGRAVDGLPFLQEAIGEADRLAIRAEAPLWTSWLAEAHLTVGQIAEADTLAQRAADLAGTQGERANLAWALRLLGDIAARSQSASTGRAEQHLRGALALAKDLGMRPLQARCHLGLGKLYHRIGRQDEARAELATAITMLREMGMSFWLPEAEAELAQADGSVTVGHVGCPSVRP